MLTPEYLESIDWNRVVKLYHQLNIDVCSDIINRILKDKGVISSTTRNQLQVLMEANGSEIYEKVLLKASELDTETLTRLKRIYENMAKKDLQGYKELYKYRGKSFKLSDSQLKILNGAILSNGQDLQNFTNTIAWASQQLYVNAIDQAFLDTVTGGLDYETAIYNAVQDLASKGVTLQDSLGRNIALETAVRRNVLTGIKQTADRMNRDIEEELGCDGYETTAHLGARPTHEEWQGKQFARTKELANKYGVPYWEDSDAKAQLNDYNCRHTYFGIILGISKPVYTKKELKEMNNAKVNVDGKEMSLYDAKSKLTSYKRTLNKYERERDTYKKTLDKNKNDKELEKLYNSRVDLVNKWQTRYNSLNKTINNHDKTNVTNNSVLTKAMIKASKKIYNAYKDNGFENLSLINYKTGKSIGGINTSKNISSVGYSSLQKREMKKYHRELLAIHNHPYNHIPSLEDIYEMFNNDALCGIIVRTEKYNYYLFPKINTLDTIKENFDEFSSWFEKRLGKFNDEFFSKYPNKSNDELNYMAFKEVFERMGWKYGREKI